MLQIGFVKEIWPESVPRLEKIHCTAKRLHYVHVNGTKQSENSACQECISPSVNFSQSLHRGTIKIGSLLSFLMCILTTESDIHNKL